MYLLILYTHSKRNPAVTCTFARRIQDILFGAGHDFYLFRFVSGTLLSLTT